MTNNDTSTLNGALQELGETIADNLVSMGVVDADASDGLTTLADKILDIQTQTSPLTLTSDKPILSYYDSESAVLTANFVGAGFTVELYDDTDTLVGAMTDNDDGTYSYTYNSAGVGDIGFYAKVGSLVSETCSIEDCFFNGLNTDAFTIPANTTFSNDGDMITATTTTSGEKLVYLDHTLSNTDNWEFEIEIAQLGVSQSIAPFWNDNSFWGGQTNGNFNQVYSNMNGESTLSETVTIDKLFKVTRQDGVTTVSYNDKTVQSKTVSHKSSFRVGFYINRSRTQYYKNIKLKPL